MGKRGAAHLRGRVGRCMAAVAVLFALAAVPVARPHAATITVNSADDTVADDGVCTLREAITAANNNAISGAMSGECAAGGAATDTIIFDPAIFGVARTITLASAQLAITSGVTITGPGTAPLTVRRETTNPAKFRIFQINTGDAVTISGLTITGGAAIGTDPDSPEYGGGVRSNTAQNNLTLDNVTVTGNAANEGGGIYARGVLIVRNSTVSNNAADTGGGVSFTSNTTGVNLRVSGSTFSGNTATGLGGGGLRVNLSNAMSRGVVTNSTFSGNTNPNANTFGGGGILSDNDGLAVTNSTIAGNGTDGTDPAPSGGIRVFPGKSVTLNGTIVAGNTAAGGANDVSGDASGGYNLIGDGTGLSGIAGGMGGNIVGTAAAPIDPRLAPLGPYGGTVRTRALLPGSPALDAAGATCANDPLTGTALAVDQRGVARPQPATGGACDIGAFESRGFTLAASAGTAQQTTAGRPFPTALAAALAPVDSGVPLAGATVTFTINPMGGATGTFAGGATTATATANASGVATAPTLTAGSAAGTFTVTASAAGAADVTFTLTVNAPPAISTTALPATTAGVAYNQTVTATGGTAPLTFGATGLPAGLMIGMTNGAITGTPTMAGTATVTVTVTDAAGATAMQTLTLTVNPPISISTTSLPAATRSRPYNQSVTATGGTAPLTYSAMGLPSGLMIDMTSGAITGTPTTAAVYSFTITVTDGVSATATQMFTFTVNFPPTIPSPTLPDATVGTSYNQMVPRTSGTAPLTFSATGLPTGLMLNAMTGAITGTPTATGTSTVTVTITDANGATATRMLTLNVNNPAPAITALSQNGVAPGGAAFTLTVTGTGFVNGSVVRVNGANLTTTFVSATQLTAQVPASAVAMAGTLMVTVMNAAPGGGTSNALAFTVAVPNATPAAYPTVPPMGMPNRTPPTPRATAPAMGAPNAAPPRR